MLTRKMVSVLMISLFAALSLPTAAQTAGKEDHSAHHPGSDPSQSVPPKAKLGGKGMDGGKEGGICGGMEACTCCGMGGGMDGGMEGGMCGAKDGGMEGGMCGGMEGMGGCGMHDEMMGGKSKQDRHAMMEKRIKAMTPEMRKKRMAMMEKHMQMMRREMQMMRAHLNDPPQGKGDAHNHSKQ